MFALVADGDVFDTLGLPEDNPTGIKWSAGLRSGLIFKKTIEYSQLRSGCLFDGENFYDPEDLEMRTPLPKSPIDNPDVIKYAGIVGNEVIGFYTLDKTIMSEDFISMVCAGLESNPDIIEFDSSLNVQPGWIWNGTQFLSPEE